MLTTMYVISTTPKRLLNNEKYIWGNKRNNYVSYSAILNYGTGLNIKSHPDGIRTRIYRVTSEVSHLYDTQKYFVF